MNQFSCFLLIVLYLMLTFPLRQCFSVFSLNIITLPFWPGLFGNAVFDLETILVKQRSEREKHFDLN